jgi:type VI secretion system protein ImpH
MHPENPRLGESLRPADDPFRFSQEPSLSFAPTMISAFKSGKEGKPSRMEVLFFGLFGPNGPLPLHLTDYARDRIRNSDDMTFSRFADVFHHRLLSLFYRSWANARPAISYDRPETDRFATYIGATCGYGMPSLDNRDGMPDLAKRFYAGLLSHRAKSADGLRIILEGFFNLPVGIEQFVGHWMELPEDGRLRLGESINTGGLGTTAIIGEQVWDCQSKFRITFGPLELADYKKLLPGGSGLKQLKAIVQNYIGHELIWDIKLILKKEQVPAMKLGKEQQLGWTSMVTRTTPEEDLDKLLLNPFFSTI